jgi:hypothetical protein
MGKYLLLQTIQAVLSAMPVKTENFLHILEHYIEEDKMDINRLVSFLKVTLNNPIDHQAKLLEIYDDFDGKYGTETSPVIYQYELPEKISVERYEHAQKYTPSPIGGVNAALETLIEFDIRYADFVFIEVGCGMGRNLLLASHFPFKRLVGIELSSYLYQIASSNLGKYTAPGIQCTHSELTCINALDFSFPEENMILFLYEPFSSETAERFFKKLELFVRGRDNKIILIFFSRVYPVIQSSKIFTFIRRLTWWAPKIDQLYKIDFFQRTS